MAAMLARSSDRAPAPWPLRWHLVALMLVAMLPVLAFAAAMIAIFGRHQLEVHHREFAETARLLSRTVDAELQQTVSALEVLALDPSLVSNEFYGKAMMVLESQPAWSNIVVIRADGEHLLNLRMPFGTPLPRLNRPELFVAAAKTRLPVITDMEEGVVAKRRLISVAVPVTQGSEVTHMVVAGIEAEEWEKLLSTRLATGRYASLLDRKHVLIVRTLDGASGSPAAADTIAALERGDDRGQKPLTIAGERVYAAFHTSSYTGWAVGVYAPVALIDGPVLASLGPAATGFALLLFFSVLLAVLFARGISRPIRQLTASVQAVGKGDPPLVVNASIAEVRDANEALQEASRLLAARLEREQAARGEVEAMSEAKDRFIAMLGHELRNPLAPLAASLYVLDRVAPESAAAKTSRAVIARQVDHLTRLVDDLLDVNRIARGKVELRRAPTRLGDVVEKAADDHRSLMRDAGIDFAVDVPAAPIWVDGDAARLTQVITNLLSNSAKFTPRGGRVTLSLSRHGDVAEVRVGDTGAGIAQELLGSLFDPFVQGDQDIARSSGGLGLGLSLVKGLTELHGGSVTAYSAGADRGAEFVVRLPVGSPAVAADVRASARAPGGSSGKQVLVIDDNVDAAESLAKVLEIAGHTATVAHDGERALELGRASPPDAILCDLGLPGMDGYSVARSVRADARFNATRLFAVTGYAQPEHLKRAEEAGFDALLAKPVDPRIIADMLADRH